MHYQYQLNTIIFFARCQILNYFYLKVIAFKLWYNKTLKEVIDKPRIFHQLVPMQVQYEFGTTRVI